MPNHPNALRRTDAQTGEELVITAQQLLSIGNPSRSIRELISARSPSAATPTTLHPTPDQTIRPTRQPTSSIWP
ncbi:MAG: hypothetical protein ABIW33_03930 [Sphingomicrobium sp.]